MTKILTKFTKDHALPRAHDHLVKAGVVLDLDEADAKHVRDAGAGRDPTDEEIEAGFDTNPDFTVEDEAGEDAVPAKKAKA